jgi:undecaprenyl-diphosphatase
MSEMNIIEAALLGLIQGLTEFIPVSSSGHLVVVQDVFSGASDHLFLEFINIGTLLALIVFFRKRILHIMQDVFLNKNTILARNIILTAIPAGLIGLFLADFIGSAPFFGSVIVVTVALAVVGVIMVVLEKLPKASQVDNGEQLSSRRAFTIGLVQMLALIPGVSRSGSTIIAGRLAGLDAVHAAEYSFLASLPIMLGVTLKVFIKPSDQAYLFDHMPMLILGNVVAFAVGMFAIGFLMRYLARHSLALFGWYRISLAAVLTVYLLLQ